MTTKRPITLDVPPGLTRDDAVAWICEWVDRWWQDRLRQLETDLLLAMEAHGLDIEDVIETLDVAREEYRSARRSVRATIACLCEQHLSVGLAHVQRLM